MKKFGGLTDYIILLPYKSTTEGVPLTLNVIDAKKTTLHI